MKAIETTIYQCSFCGKYYKMKHFCIRHEKQCKKNPNNQHDCYDCRFLEVGRKKIDNNQLSSVKFFRCTKLDKEMHTCKAESRGFSKSLNTERMPIMCDKKELIEIPFG